MKTRRPSVLVPVAVFAGLILAAWLGLHHRPPAGAPASDSPADASPSTATADIYPDENLAPGQVQAALVRASQEKKNVILDFGGNWCGDCKVLDIYFHQPANLALLRTNYELVHINVGRYDQNQEIADKYGIVLSKGVPALAVLNSEGELLYSQRNGEFEAMRRMDPSSVTEFLNKWKPQGPGSGSGNAISER